MASVFKRTGSDFFYAQWFNREGKRVTRCTNIKNDARNKNRAISLATEWESDAIAAESTRPIDPAHLADYETMLKAKHGGDSQYIADTIGKIRTLCASAGFKLPDDIRENGVNHFLVKMKDEERTSPRTIGAWITAMKGFTNWLAKNGRIHGNPLAGMTKPNPKKDRRLERRMMLPDEWHWLRDVTRRSGERYGMKAAERVLLYETAIQSGLRAGELRELTKIRLFLDGKTPYVLARASTTKNAKDARQYIRSDLAAALRQHVQKKTPQAAVFDLPAPWDMAKMLRADLAAARQEWIKAAGKDADERQRREQSDFLVEKNHAGEVLDFHALRHTCGAWLAKAGVAPKVVQAVMRHFSITLTMDTYGHLFPGEEAAAIDALGRFLNEGPERLAATGTDGKQAQHSAQHFGQLDGSVNAAVKCADDQQSAGDGESKSLRLADLGDGLQDVATGSENRAAGTRTRNQQIMSLLL